MSTIEPPEPWSDDDFRPIAAALRAKQGESIPAQRVGLVQSRLRSRLEERGYSSFTQFFEKVVRGRPDGSGMQLVIDLNTVNHSTFFREPEPLLAIAEHLADRLRVGPARAWCAGCSAGQEPYSLVMTLAEMSPSASDRVEVIASDLSLEMLRDAASATYEPRELTAISADRLRRFFLRGRGRRAGFYRVAPEIRRPVTFRHFDLRDESWPVAGDLDAILCRNVAIYLPEPDRLPMLARLADRLRPGGRLALGLGEIIAGLPPSLRRIGPSLFRREPSP